MANSSLASYIDRTNGNYYARPQSALISKIMVHNSFANGDRYAMSELINSGSSGYHYGISTDGIVGLFTDEFRAAKGCTSSQVNDTCVHILVMPESANGDISNKNLEILLDLVEDICRRNFILEFNYLPNNKSASNLLEHNWYDSTSCPGSMKSKFSYIAQTVNSRIKSAKKSSESDAIKAQNTISVGATSPYLATIDPYVTYVNYSSLRDMGCVGVSFCAGWCYDTNHVVHSPYISPNLTAQVQQAQNANMLFSFYAIVRARSESDARKECSELFYVVSKFPPKLGIWLNLDLSMVSDDVAKAIVQIYYNKIVSWGLKGKCGIYCTTALANKINWPQWSDKFAFWWISPLTNLNCMENVLTPSLFEVR